jgi:serine/threonine protein kinase
MAQGRFCLTVRSLSECLALTQLQGDLKQFLLATRGGGKDGNTSRATNVGSKGPRPPQLSVTQIIQLASQVAQGMEHLSNQRFVHCDLAARNCLIASNLTVKISLSALSRDTYSKEYCKYRNEVYRKPLIYDIPPFPHLPFGLE